MAQINDYDVANNTGAQVRTDINSIFDAIKTCNSGSGVPSNSVAFMLYGDTNNGTLKIRNNSAADSTSPFTEIGPIDQPNLGLLPVSGGTMSGQILGNAGSLAASPAFSFENDSDTGMYRTSVNKIGFACAGQEIAIFDGSGLSLEDQHHVAFREPSSAGSSGVIVKAPNSLAGDVNFTLPNTEGNAGEFLKTDGSGGLSYGAPESVPSGAILCWPVATLPTGYLECNGDAIPNGTGTVQNVQANYSALYAVIGGNLPDLRGEFVRGWASNVNDSTRDQGRAIWTHGGTDQADDIKSHNHTATSTSSVTDPGHRHAPTSTGSPNSTLTNGTSIATNDNEVGNYGAPPGGTGLGPIGTRQFMDDASTGISVSTTTSIDNTGGTETRPRNVALMYIIKI